MRRSLSLPVAAALLLIPVSMGSPGVQKTATNLDVYKRCPMEGSARSPCARELNRLKNRWQREPGPLEINPRITLEAMLAEGDDERRWSVDEGAEVTGFVVSVEDTTGGESVNCGGNSKGSNDFHINLVLAPSVARSSDYECKRAIVEMTPRWQLLKGWTFDQVRRELEGKWVRFRGWMFFDRIHLNQSFNTRASKSPRCGGIKGPLRCTGPVNARLWRATAWEIHPVTSYTVVAGPPAH